MNSDTKGSGIPLARELNVRGELFFLVHSFSPPSLCTSLSLCVIYSILFHFFFYFLLNLLLLLIQVPVLEPYRLLVDRCVYCWFLY